MTSEQLPLFFAFAQQRAAELAADAGCGNGSLAGFTLRAATEDDIDENDPPLHQDGTDWVFQFTVCFNDSSGLLLSAKSTLFLTLKAGTHEEACAKFATDLARDAASCS